ncbi:MAG: TRAP transporter substrate-binding protein [Rhodobiaceae bacterium]|nr:TRAP transporter substrate-binding protein [Rhodobiaceae bacterium]MCC0057098.1 TRAP transporter substrate-binding protein [Rhodobiaceae bacterium]
MFHHRIWAGAALICMIAAGFIVSPASAEGTTLRYSNWLPPSYVFHKDIMLPWMEAVEKATDGRVKVDVSPKVIGTVAGQYDVAADGLADITFVLPGYTPGRFTAIEGLEGAFLGDDPQQRCPADWAAYDKFLAPIDYFKEVHIIGIYCANSGQFSMTKQAINSLDDLKGLKIRTPAPAVTQALELLGAVPVSKPASEVYELANGGIIDGAVFPYDSVVGFKLDGVLKTITRVPGGVSTTVVVIAMNKGVWDKLSDADKKAIDSVSGAALAKRAGDALKVAQDQAIDVLKNGGATFVTMSPDTLSALKKAIEPVRQEWIAKAMEAGLSDPAAMLEFVENYKVAN